MVIEPRLTGVVLCATPLSTAAWVIKSSHIKAVDTNGWASHVTVAALRLKQPLQRRRILERVSQRTTGNYVPYRRGAVKSHTKERTFNRVACSFRRLSTRLSQLCQPGKETHSTRPSLTFKLAHHLQRTFKISSFAHSPQVQFVYICCFRIRRRKPDSSTNRKGIYNTI